MWREMGCPSLPGQVVGGIGRSPGGLSTVDFHMNGERGVIRGGCEECFCDVICSLPPPLPFPLPPFPSSTLPPSEGVSLLLRHMFEQHQASNPVEEMVKGATNGDMVRVEQLLEAGACHVDDQFNGRTALQAAAQNGHIDVVNTLVHYDASLEEEVGTVQKSFTKMVVFWN